MSDAITFLPYLRRGLAQLNATPDPLTGALRGDQTFNASVQIAGQSAGQTLLLRSAGEAVGLGAAQVLRTEPRPDSAGVEPNYFPLIELAAPDLPWLLTPAAADGRDRLRPWLVLVAVREQEGVSVAVRAEAALPVLRIEPPAVPADELPDLSDSWAWAHAQSLVPVKQIDDAVEAADTAVVARLVCPRRLVPLSGYVACLVPAFDAGVVRGLGQTPTGSDLEPAWQPATLGETIELPVYYQWRFTTGEAGEFEALCRRLQPQRAGAVMGLHAMDVTDPGLVRPAAETVLIDMEGALGSVGSEPRDWPDDDRARFQDDIVPLVNAGIDRAEYDPAVREPVVAPPAYGSWPAGVPALPGHGWLRTLNAHPARRGAAGLGAQVVRAAQEALVATAWEQAGDLRATTAALRGGRLAAEIGRSWTNRAVALEDSDLLQLMAPILPLLPGSGQSFALQLGSSPVPRGLVSSAYLRRTRPGTPLARDWAALAGNEQARLGADHVATTLAATADPKLRRAIEFAAFGPPDGMQTTDPTLDDAPASVVADGGRHEGSTGGASTIADTLRSAMSPLDAVRASVVARVPALGDVLGEGELPTTLALAPVFDDALCWDLLELGSSWILPGVDSLGANRVRLLEVDESFVGSFLIGANHALVCELLWRGYPVDLRATFFHRFWERVDGGGDITDLSGWTQSKTIEENIGRPAESQTAVIVRGDLVRRYPTAHWFLQEAAIGDDGAWTPADGGHIEEAAFLGTLDPQTAFYGFDISTKVVRGDRDRGVPGYFVVIEEQPGAPRLGLDVAQPGDFQSKPTSWDDVSWGHLVSSQEELDALTHARATGVRIEGLKLGKTIWGRNSAHIARASWQRPFRMLIDADLLI
jgi:hypothetical protein